MRRPHLVTGPALLLLSPYWYKAAAEGRRGQAAPHRMVPARSGLKAYNQSFRSLSLSACRRTPRCFVHTAKVLGVWEKQMGREVSAHRPALWGSGPPVPPARSHTHVQHTRRCRPGGQD